VILPVLSTLVALMVLFAVWVPAVMWTGPRELVGDCEPVFWVACVLTWFLITVTSNFFDVAMVVCAEHALGEESGGVGAALMVAGRSIGAILGWSAIKCTVGVVLSINWKSRWLNRETAQWISGGAWDVATFFAIPAIVFERAGPWISLKRSVQVAKARWGEGVTGAAAMTILTPVVVMPLAAIGGLGLYVLATTGFTTLWFVGAAVGIAAATVASIICGALNVIFRVAVYSYALTGQIPAAFDAALVRSAFERHTGDGPPPTPPFRGGGATVTA
jgi:hypothetical protein